MTTCVFFICYKENLNQASRLVLVFFFILGGFVFFDLGSFVFAAYRGTLGVSENFGFNLLDKGHLGVVVFLAFGVDKFGAFSNGGENGVGSFMR